MIKAIQYLKTILNKDIETLRKNSSWNGNGIKKLNNPIIKLRGHVIHRMDQVEDRTSSLEEKVISPYTKRIWKENFKHSKGIHWNFGIPWKAQRFKL